VREQGLGAAAAPLLLVDDRLTQLDALAADIDVARTFDERADVAVALAAEGTVGVAVPPGAAGRPSSRPAGARVFRRHAISCLVLRHWSIVVDPLSLVTCHLPFRQSACKHRLTTDK